MVSENPSSRYPRVLMIDDDESLHRLVKLILQPLQAEVVCFTDGISGLEAIEAQLPDIILLDYQLPDTNGVAILSELKVQHETKDIPVIVITSDDSHSVLSQCFEKGAEDYVRKPFCAAELRSRVKRVLDNREMLSQLRQVALHDSLTGLPNRALLLDRLQQSILRHGGDPSYHYALLFIDFDRFKQINDSLGHDAGDELLVGIAKRLSRSVRRTDSIGFSTLGRTAARFGGDEFVVLLEGLSGPGDARIVAERLLDVLAIPHSICQQTIVSTASIGVVEGNDRYTSAEEVLRDADTAMYHAKIQGKGRYCLFNESMHHAAQRRLELEQDLRDAMTKNQLSVAYQPIVHLATGEIENLEALVRWNHPEKGVISPAEFIPIAEECNLINEIGFWVFKEAVSQFAKWRKDYGRTFIPAISVNLSRKQLLANDLVDSLVQLVYETGIEAEVIHLEITESTAMQDIDATTAVLARLRQAGFKIAIDDFGTGYSSLGCLHHFHFDVLKIDGVFVRKLDRSHEYDYMVQAISLISKRMGMKIVAEGIETADQVTALRNLSCDFGQGYFFSRPVAADQVPMLCRVQPALAPSFDLATTDTTVSTSL